MAAIVTAAKPTSMQLPVMYVEPGRLLSYVLVHLDGWPELGDVLQVLHSRGLQPRMSYVYQAPRSGRLVGALVLDVQAIGDDQDAVASALANVPGLHADSVQRPESGLAVAEQEKPDLVGTPAVIFGRSIVGSVVRGIVAGQGAGGESLLHRVGHDAGELAASAVPPLLQRLGVPMSLELLTRRVTDLQAMGWATIRGVRVDGQLHGEATLADTFESAAWDGKAPSPRCHFLSGFVEGVFSFAWQRPVDCREVECQATGAPACRFVFGPTQP